MSFNIAPSADGAAPVTCLNETSSGIAYLANTTGTACSDPAFTFDVTYFFDYAAYIDTNGQPIGANLTVHHQDGDARQTGFHLLDDIFFTYSQSGRSCYLCRSIKWDGDHSFTVTSVDE